MPTPKAAAKEQDQARLGSDIVAGVISGVVVGLFLFLGQFLVDNNRADREHEREDRQVAARDKIEENRNEQGILLENLRFVRGLSSADPTLSRPFRDMDLHGLELSGLSLAGADFGNANLSGTSFRNTELSGASFDGADVEKADFTGADLAKASFNYSTRDSNDSGKEPESLAQANLNGAYFRNILTWGEVNLSGSTLCGAGFDTVDFTKAFISGATVDKIPSEGGILPVQKDTSLVLCSD